MEYINRIAHGVHIEDIVHIEHINHIDHIKHIERIEYMEHTAHIEYIEHIVYKEHIMHMQRLRAVKPVINMSKPPKPTHITTNYKHVSVHVCMRVRTSM